PRPIVRTIGRSVGWVKAVIGSRRSSGSSAGCRDYVSVGPAGADDIRPTAGSAIRPAGEPRRRPPPRGGGVGRVRTGRMSGRPAQPGQSWAETSPDSYANTTAWTRSRRPSFESTLDTWLLTVASPTTSRAAISVLARPR